MYDIPSLVLFSLHKTHKWYNLARFTKIPRCYFITMIIMFVPTNLLLYSYLMMIMLHSPPHTYNNFIEMSTLLSHALKNDNRIQETKLFCVFLLIYVVCHPAREYFTHTRISRPFIMLHACCDMGPRFFRSQSKELSHTAIFYHK